MGNKKTKPHFQLTKPNWIPKTKPFEGRNSRETHPEYHTRAWRGIRAQHLLNEPFCRKCKSLGYIGVIATVVDHIVRVSIFVKRGQSFWEASTPDNLQSLCASCHNSKSGKESNQ